jgi:DNA-binding transcriptional MerR regulator
VAKTASEIPGKLFFKIGEVCDITDTQPYVLRFWESEFPQLSPRKNRSGQRVYQRKDIDMILRIKTLLYEEEYTIAGARRKLEDESAAGRPAGKIAPRPAATKSAPAARHAHVRGAGSEAEHPVDALEERAAAGKTKAGGSGQDAARQKALEAALHDVRTSLGEILTILKGK